MSARDTRPSVDLQRLRDERDQAEGVIERLLATTDLRSAPESIQTEMRKVIRAKHNRR